MFEHNIYYYRNPSAYGEIAEPQAKSGPLLRDPKLKAEVVMIY
jgi:hypothetical protein